MRLKKIMVLAFVAFVAGYFLACSDAASTLEMDDGIGNIPGYNPAWSASSKETPESSSSGEVVTSSTTPEPSSSAEQEIDFGDSKIQVDGSGVAVITDEYMEAVSDDEALELDDLKQAFDYNEAPSTFTGGDKTRFSVDDFDFSKNEYYCYTESQEWLEISKEKLLETGLPFLWGGSAFESREGFLLSFETPCGSIFIKKN